jgi:thiosulfate dehydrogenase (quinone) large subunit
MSEPKSDSAFVFLFRMLMAWTFLYAASHQVLDPKFTIVPLLQKTTTFHDFFALFTAPAIAPAISFLVAWGHLLIGLSLLVGLLVRVSAAFGMAMLTLYWMVHMDWPYIENHNNFIVDYHVVYVLVLGYLIAKRAGHVLGLDGWAARQPAIEHSVLRPLVA